MTSDKKNVSLLADIFIKKGLLDIIISPGSRNAPIVLAFAGNKKINALSIIDERSAGFFALGMAQQLNKAVAVACTSGSALLNYAPAIAEAYYQKIPLLILTADRPAELIDQGDGQTIRQKDVFKNYIKGSFELPVVIDDPATRQIAEQVINTAIDQTLFPEPGPVHINIPFREPLYNTSEEEVVGLVYSTVKQKEEPNGKEIEKLAEEWNSFNRKLIIVGQGKKNPALNARLAALAKLNDVVVLTETTSNLHDANFIDCIDNIVSSFHDSDEAEFKPDLLVSLGGQVVSKMVKRYLRLNPAASHWHFSESEERTDTYFILNKVLAYKPENIFKQMAPYIEVGDENYASKWLERRDELRLIREDYLGNIPFSDLKLFDFLLQNIPEDTILHFGNSTPVRYSQLFGSNPKYTVHSNRGVSGIDGQVSTAAGAAKVTNKINTIITGDLGFFYDSNSLMNLNLPSNLKIILINNGGGGIFRFIPGPDNSPFLEEFFETKHNWTAKKIAETFDVKYFRASSENELVSVFDDFYNLHSRPALLEIFTPGELNADVLKNYFSRLKSG